MIYTSCTSSRARYVAYELFMQNLKDDKTSTSDRKKTRVLWDVIVSQWRCSSSSSWELIVAGDMMWWRSWRASWVRRTRRHAVHGPATAALRRQQWWRWWWCWWLCEFSEASRRRNRSFVRALYCSWTNPCDIISVLIRPTDRRRLTTHTVYADILLQLLHSSHYVCCSDTCSIKSGN